MIFLARVHDSPAASTLSSRSSSSSSSSSTNTTSISSISPISPLGAQHVCSGRRCRNFEPADDRDADDDSADDIFAFLEGKRDSVSDDCDLDAIWGFSAAQSSLDKTS